MEEAQELTVTNTGTAVAVELTPPVNREEAQELTVVVQEDVTVNIEPAVS